MEAATGNTFSGLDADVGGDVVLPAFLLLHVVKVKGGLISLDPLDGGLILLRILEKVTKAPIGGRVSDDLPIESRTVHHPSHIYLLACAY